MQLYPEDDSDLVTVEFEPQDMRSFARSWPRFHGPDSVCFTFERSTGDLVDTEPIEFDGPEASAIAEDAWSYFEKQREPDPPGSPRSPFRKSSTEATWHHRSPSSSSSYPSAFGR